MPRDIPHTPESCQLELPWNSAQELAGALTQVAGGPVDVTITDNASSMVSVRRGAGETRVRVHHMFLSAPPDVVEALARWAVRGRDRRAAARIDRFIAANGHRIRSRAPRRAAIRTQGAVWDLQLLYDEVNREEFGGAVKAHITWGRRAPVKNRRSIRFGSYAAATGVIRIHPLLDQDFVPRYFVKYIVFHEMLHAALGTSERAGGRRRVHPPEFAARERAYADYERAAAWQCEPGNLKRLLSKKAARPGARRVS